MSADVASTVESPQRRWAKKNPDRIKGYKEKYRAAHPEVGQEYYQRNKAAILERIRNYRKLHPQTRTLTEEQKARLKETGRAWYERNRAMMLERSHANYRKNRKARSEKAKQWRLLHPDKVKQYSKKHYNLHPEKSRAISLRYYHQHKEEIREKRKAWGKSHRSVWVFRAHKRRALQKAATVNLAKIQEWMSDVKSKSSAVCYYCHDRVPISEIHFDHIVALANGGAHSVENLCVSCSACNLSKNAKPIRTWISIGQQLLEL